MQDRLLKNKKRLFEMVVEEHQRQLKKWGVQDHPFFTWLAFVTEELGELSMAMSEYNWRKGPKAHIIAEAIQVATLSLKVAEMFMDASDKEIKADAPETHTMDLEAFEEQLDKYKQLERRCLDMDHFPPYGPVKRLRKKCHDKRPL